MLDIAIRYVCEPAELLMKYTFAIASLNKPETHRPLERYWN